MESFRFADNLEGEAVIALGLPAARLILAGAGGALSWALTELPVPAPLRLSLACLLAVVVAGLAWGRAQGESLARWGWLAVGFCGRVATPRRLGWCEWVDAELPPGPDSAVEAGAPGVPLVGFVALVEGSGCSTVCRAVLDQLCREGFHLWGGPPAPWRLMDPGTAVPVKRARPRVLVFDLGATPPARITGAAVALILVWDGTESYPGEFEARVAGLQRSCPSAALLVALNRAGVATGIARRAAGAGASLVAAIPPDELLGLTSLRASGGTTGAAVEGVRALARHVLAASRPG
ncbi:MAG: hypothetical protein ACRENY_01725 [Candidatus Dormibacteria bacterium]